MNNLLPTLEEWALLRSNLDKEYEAFCSLTGCSAASPFWDPIFRVWAAYTKEISARIGDTCEWLSWFEFENDMGKKGLTVTTEKGETRNIRTLTDLAWVIQEA